MYIKKLEIAQGRYRKFSLLVVCYAKAARVNNVDKPQPGNNLKQGLRVKNGFTHSEKLLGRSPKVISNVFRSSSIAVHQKAQNN